MTLRATVVAAGLAVNVFPGAAYCDVLAASVHDTEYPQAIYDGLVNLAAGKPVALGEVDTVPAPEILVQQPLWTWFMTGADALYRANKPAPLLAHFADPRVVHRGDLLPTGQQVCASPSRR